MLVMQKMTCRILWSSRKRRNDFRFSQTRTLGNSCFNLAKIDFKMYTLSWTKHQIQSKPEVSRRAWQ